MADSLDLSKILGQRADRTIVLDRAASKIDRENRTFELAFSSETPVYRWYGWEILDHSKGAADLKRVNNGAALLLCHDRSQQVGAVVRKSARVDEDRVGRCDVKISRSRDDVLDDVEDDIRSTVSFAYMPWKMVLQEKKIDGLPVYLVTKWEVIEISLEPTPADPSVGVGRTIENVPDPTTPNFAATRGLDQQTTEEVRTMPEVERTQDTTATPPPVSEEVLRAREITDLGEIFGERELAITMAAQGNTSAEFKAAVAKKRRESQTVVPPEDPNTTAGRQGGDLARVQSRINLQHFRGEDAQGKALRAGHWLRAALLGNEQSMQFCREKGISILRAQSESDNESGGFLVPTEFENVMIDLRLEYGVFRRNANVVPMASLRKERPRRKGGLKAYPIGARGASRRLTESKKEWDRVGLDAKKWGVLAKYEDELSEDSVISIADDLTGEAAFAFTQVEDECGFLGDGTSDYHGIVGVITALTNLSGTIANIASIQVGSGNLWSELVLIDILGMVGKLPSFARRTGQVKWYCSNEFWATVLTRIAFVLGGNSLGEIQNEVAPVFLGKPVEIVEVMPHVEANAQIPLLYGNLAQAAMFGDRRGIAMKMTDSNDTDFEEDQMAIKATERFDINVHDVGNASGTATARKPGPVVALRTAAS